MTHILIADDECSLRRLIEATVASPEIQTTQAENGADAVRLSQEIRFDLIILDWMMPQMSGIQVLQALRAEPRTATVPVIMLTAHGQTKDQELAMAMGATRYIINRSAHWNCCMPSKACFHCVLTPLRLKAPPSPGGAVLPGRHEAAFPARERHAGAAPRL